MRGLRLIGGIYEIPFVLLLCEYLRFGCYALENRIDVCDELGLKFCFRLKRSEACDFVGFLVKFNEAIFRD